MSDYRDLYPLRLPGRASKPRASTGPILPITEAAIDALADYFGTDADEFRQRAAQHPAHVLLAVALDQPDRLPDRLVRLIHTAGVMEAQRDDKVRMQRYESAARAEADRQALAQLAGHKAASRGRASVQHRHSTDTDTFEQAHAAMLVSLGTSPTDAAREAAQYQAYLNRYAR